MRALALCLALVCILPLPFAAAQGQAAPPTAPAAVPAPAVMLDAISLEFEILEVPGANRDDRETDQEFVARVRALQAAGKARSATRVRLTTLDGGDALVQFGQQVAIATSRRTAPAGREGFGGAPVSYQYQNVGTMISAKPTVNRDGTIRVTIKAEQSQVQRPKSDAEGKESEVPAGVGNISVQTSVSGPAGRPLVLCGMHARGGGEEMLTVFLVTASVVK